MRLLISTILFITLSLSGLAQENPYNKVDSLMRGYKEKIKSVDDLYKVVYYIRTNFEADSLRLRASFIWITENIAYDIKALIREDPAAGQLIYVIRYKKAICGGYASLLKYFCDAFNIESEIVEGYARTGKNSILLSNNSLRSNHAWNAVKINNCWKLLDPTWASGYCDELDAKKPAYHKEFREIYYFTKPEKLLLNHFPGNKKFQLTDKYADKRTFKNSPLFTSEFLAYDISDVKPENSLLKATVGDTLLFKLRTESRINDIVIYSETTTKTPYQTTTNYNDGWIEFQYPVTYSGYYNLYIGLFNNIIDSRVLLIYKLDVKSKN